MWINMKCGIIVRCCEMQKKKKKAKIQNIVLSMFPFHMFSLLFFLKFRVREQ